MDSKFLEFEKPIAEIEARLEELELLRVIKDWKRARARSVDLSAAGSQEGEEHATKAQKVVPLNA